MQTCYEGLKGISFDLGDNAKWEYIFLENSQPGALLKKNESTKKEMATKDEEDEDEQLKDVLDLPPSWVERLDISKEKHELRTPSGRKYSQYQNARVESFAPYVRKDGLFERISVTKNPKQPAEIREAFKNRKFVPANRNIW